MKLNDIEFIKTDKQEIPMKLNVLEFTITPIKYKFGPMLVKDGFARIYPESIEDMVIDTDENSDDDDTGNSTCKVDANYAQNISK